MRYLKLELFVALAVLVAAGLLGRFFLGDASAKATEEKGYAALNAELEPFRADFNAAADHVRAVLLVGPT